MDGKVVYISVEDRLETLQLPPNVTVSQIDALLRSICQISDPQASLVLVDTERLKVPVGVDLPPNSPENPYRITLLRPCNGMLVDEVEMEFMGLEERIAELEKQKDDSGKLCSAITDLKNGLHTLKNKLETTKHTSWINCYKDLPPSSRKLRYRRLSDDKQRVVRQKFFEICNNTLSEEVRQCLRLPSFDCSNFSDQEILHILQNMYLDFGLLTKFDIDLNVLRNFLFTVYKNYNEVPFHNFRHSFCVTQMMYAMIVAADLPNLIDDLEILVLLTSCICHDLDHPGYNNIYQVNARTELALRYNDISPLENHHCSMAFRILELPDCNLFAKMPKDQFRIVREGIIRCILATDMGRHNEILTQFKEVVEEGFKYSNKSHVNLLSMVLIKVADISNEARPMKIAEPWLDKLLQEFFTQSDAEKEEGLPVTPFMDRDKITKPSSQCSFIGFVLLPLFEALGDLLPQLQPMIVEPVREALDHYRRLNEAAKDEQRLHRKSVVTLDVNSTASSAPNSPVRTVMQFTKSNNTLNKSFQKSEEGSSFSGESQEFPDEIVTEQTDEDEEGEEGESVNEVAVSEKALKFKISTENTGSGRKSYPGSRKGSREKPLQLAEQEFARVLHEQDRSFHSSDSGDKKSWSSNDPPSSDDYNRYNRNISLDHNWLHDSVRRSLPSPDEKKETRSLSFVEQQRTNAEIILDSAHTFQKKRSVSTCSPDDLKDFASRGACNAYYRKKSNTPSKSPELKEEQEEEKLPGNNTNSSRLGSTAEKPEPPSKCSPPDVISNDQNIVPNSTAAFKESSASEITKNKGQFQEDERQQDLGSKCCSEGHNDNSKPLVQFINNVKNVDQASKLQNIDITVSESYVPNDGKQKLPSPQSNIIKKFKNFSGLLSRRSTSSESSSSKLTVAETSSQPSSPASLKTQKTEEVEGLERKAMTLPKTVKHKSGKPNRWKVLLKSKTEDSASSSLERINKDVLCRRKSSDGEARGVSGNDKIENGLTPPEEDLSAEKANNNKAKSKGTTINGQKKSPSEAKSPHWMSILMTSFRFKKPNNS